MTRSIHIFLFIIYANFVICQVADSFSDGDFINDPLWVGSTTDFIINDEFQLQLDAPNEGTSILYTEIPFLADSTKIQFSGRLDFSPSTSNNARIYLVADSPDLDIANGYFVEIGESGSDDALRFYRQNAGETSLLAVGEPGTVASGPVDFRLRVERSPQGFWTVFTSYDSQGPLGFELEFFDDQLQFETSYFAIVCNYTSTRTDKFYFDDIIISELLPDLTPPEILSTVVNSETSLTVCFNEVIDPVIRLDQIMVNPNVGYPTSLTLLSDPACIALNFDQGLSSGIPYTLVISDIADQSGNVGVASSAFMLQKELAPGEIIINEILFDPDSGGDDFVEFYNLTDLSISLNGLVIKNQINGQSERIDTDAIIPPNGYLALTENIGYLEDTYIIKDSNALVYNELPSFPNAEGNISLLADDDIIIDQFTYNEDFHNPIVDDTEGVSLERRDPYSASIESNWGSASSIAGFATPGYQNSILGGNNLAESTSFSLKSKVFSPNGDGSEDFLEVEYGLDSDSWVLYMKVFDISGNFVKDVYSGELLSTSGTLVWDGTGKNNEKLELGIYILWFELFSPEGGVKYFKETTVIADFLN